MKAERKWPGRNSQENMRELLRRMGRVSAPLLVHLGVTFVVAYGAVLYSMLPGKSQPGDTLLTTLCALGALPFLWRMWKRDRREIPSAVENRKRGWWFFFLAFGCGIAASLAGSRLMELFQVQEVFSNEVQEGLFSSDFVLQLVGLGLIVPVTEELIFRGLFYERLREVMPACWAILCASVIFALYHGNPIQIIYAFPMALLLHFFYEQSGTLAAPILFHVGANLISVVVEHWQ